MVSRLNSLCIRYVTPRLAGDLTRASNTEQLYSEAARLGIDRIRILKRRRDSKVVARGCHAEWGDVVLKVCDPVLAPQKTYSQFYIDELLTRQPGPLFPQLHTFGLGFSVLERVPGQMLQHFGPEQMAELPLTCLVDDLATWCSTATDDAPLTASEMRGVLLVYFDRSVRRLRYKSGRQAVAATRSLLTDRRDLRRQLGALDEGVEGLSLDRTNMIGDLHPLNLIHSQRTGQVVVVDYEEIKPGHFGFDATYLLVCLVLQLGAAPALAPLASHVFSRDYLGAQANIDFFKQFAVYMLSAFMIVDGSDAGAIDQATAFIRAA